MRREVRHSEWLALAFGLAVLALWTRAFLVQVPNYNYTDSFGPVLAQLGELKLVPDSVVTLFYNGAQTVLAELIALVCRTSGLSPEWVHTGIAIVTLVAALAGLGLAAAGIARTLWAGVVAMIAVPFAWPFALSIGYYAPFWTGYSTAGYWGLGWACAVWGLWLVAPATGVVSFVPFALAGLTFLLHPTWGIVVLSVVAVGELLTVMRSADRAAALRLAIVRGVIAIAVAGPQVVLILSNLGQVTSPADEAGWWPLIQFRKSFHFYIWDGVVPYGRLAKIAVVTALSMAVVWPRLNEIKRRRAVATVLAIGVLVVIAYVVMHVIPNRSLAAVVLTRGIGLLAAASIVFVAACAVGGEGNEGSGRGESAALWVALLGLAVPTQTPYFYGISYQFSQLLPPDIRAIGDDSLSFLVTTVALLVALFLRRGGLAMVRQPVNSLGAVAVSALVVVGLTAVKLPMIPSFQGAAVPTDTWNDLTTFIREQTPADSLLIMPPYPYSIASARRSFLLDYSLLGAAVYNPPMTSFELGALRNIYGVSLDGMSHDDIKAFLLKNDGILCLLERRYRDLIASEDKVRALKRAYPSADFLVGFKPGVTPLEWVCGAYDGPVLPLPVAHENREYVLYDLSQLP